MAEQDYIRVPAAAGQINTHTYVDWCAIALGTVTAAAISIVLFTFGTGIGLSMVSPYEGRGSSSTAYFITLGLWTLWVEVSSFMAGGYLAGRLRRRVNDANEHEVDVRDGAHGIGVWAFGVVLVSFFVLVGATGIGAVISGSAAAGASAGAASDRGAHTNFVVDTLLRPAPNTAASAAAPSASATPASPAETSPASPDTRNTTRQTGRGELSRLLTFGVTRGSLSTDARTRVAQIVAQQTGLSQTEAEARVDQVMADVKDRANKARKAGVLATFMMAAALVVAGAAAAWAAALGGRHRDQDLSAFWRWR